MSRIVRSIRASWRWPHPGHGLPTLLTDEILRKLVIFVGTQLRGEHAQELRLRRAVVRGGHCRFGACLRGPRGTAERAGILQRDTGAGLWRGLARASRARPRAGSSTPLRATL